MINHFMPKSKTLHPPLKDCSYRQSIIRIRTFKARERPHSPLVLEIEGVLFLTTCGSSPYQQMAPFID